jgi:zinc/manganese transport system permease protein
MAGVLLVFSFLIVPAICGVLLGNGTAQRLWVGWGIGAFTSALGVIASYVWDLPTGATVVCAFGVVLLITGIAKAGIAKAG